MGVATEPSGGLDVKVNPFLEMRPRPSGAPGTGAVSLDRTVTLIGARSRCHVRLKSDDVSRRHALILNAGGRLYLRDLNSRTGTYRNGQRVREAYLKDGDVVRVGPFEFTVSHPGPAAVVGRRPCPADLYVQGHALPPIRLHGPVFLIGRRSGADLCVRDARVSAAHAVLVDDGKGWTLFDLGSRSGTALIDLDVESTRLRDGNTIRVADTVLRFQLLRLEALAATREEGEIEPETESDGWDDVTESALTPIRTFCNPAQQTIDREGEAPAEPTLALGVAAPQELSPPDATVPLDEVTDGSSGELPIAAEVPELNQSPTAEAALMPLSADEEDDGWDLNALADADAEEVTALDSAKQKLATVEPKPEAAPPPPPAAGPRPVVTFGVVTSVVRPQDDPQYPTGVTVAMMNPFTFEVVAPAQRASK